MSALFAAFISAHPLGNFSINQYSRLEPGRSQIKLHQVLDMAEIPTFQESASIDTDKDGKLSQDEVTAYAERLTTQYAANLILTVNGQSVPLRAVSTNAAISAGAGDLPIFHVKWDMIADIAVSGEVNRVVFKNNNYAERAGWNEMVVNRANGTSIFDSTAYGNGLSDELVNYPQESLMAPLAERTASFSYSFGSIPGNARPLENRDGKISAPVQRDKLAELIAVPEITFSVALLGLLFAVALGAMHAMSPGHGKTVVGAYLVGSKGTTKHAVFLGLTVTITHTLGVFAIGLITLFASNYILPERIMPFLGFVSGLLVFFIGISLFKDRLFGFMGWKKAILDHHHDHEHDGDDGVPHSHDGVTHTHGGSTHSHALPDEITWRNLLALGISGGLLPCPSALVLMLSAISLGRIGYGLILTVAFSVGLAATLTIVGLIFLNIRNFFGRTALSDNQLFKILPVFSAFVIAFVGAVICYNSIA